MRVQTTRSKFHFRLILSFFPSFLLSLFCELPRLGENVKAQWNPKMKEILLLWLDGDLTRYKESEKIKRENIKKGKFRGNTFVRNFKRWPGKMVKKKRMEFKEQTYRSEFNRSQFVIVRMSVFNTIRAINFSNQWDQDSSL